MQFLASFIVGTVCLFVILYVLVGRRERKITIGTVELFEEEGKFHSFSDGFLIELIPIQGEKTFYVCKVTFGGFSSHASAYSAKLAVLTAARRAYIAWHARSLENERTMEACRAIQRLNCGLNGGV